MASVEMGRADKTLNVVVHSHQRFLRDGVARLLDDLDGLAVVARTHRTRDLLEVCGRVQPDVVVVHVDLLDLELVTVVETLRRRTPPIRVVAVGTRLDAARWGTTRRWAIDSFVPASAGVDVLQAAVRDAQPGRARSDAAEPVRRLTPREQHILQLVGDGLRAREIAGVLGITTKTVENHKQRIFSKLGVQNQAHAVTLAVRAGLLSPVHELRASGDG